MIFIAHLGAAPGSTGPDSAWEFDPWIATGLFLAASLYVAGLRALRQATGRTGKLRREGWFFAAGWLALALALLSPVHAISRELFSMHMTQHELLMIVAAPLLVLARPALVFAWAFPRSVVQRALSAARAAGGGKLWRGACDVFFATALQAVALWIWHVPVLFDATLKHEGVHALQHVTFTGTALLFWQAVLFGERRAAGYGLAVLMLFVTAMHSGLLGALLTFASTVWYAGYAVAAAGRTLTPLEDQQLGGVIMWVPAGLVYVGAGVALFAAWLRESETRRRVARGVPRPMGG